MKRLFLCACIVAMGNNPLGAQIELPVFDPDKDGQGTKEVVFKQASEARDFRHGAMLSITMKDDSKMSGTLVRMDRKSHKLYVRTEAGAVPVAVDEKDMKKVDKATYAIRPAGTSEDNIVQPEIQKIVIYNGDTAVVNYVGNTLSPGEKSYLKELAEAENEVQRMQSMVNMKAGVVDKELAIQRERMRSSEIINQMVQRQLWSLGDRTAYRSMELPLPLMGRQLPGQMGTSAGSFNVLNVSHDQKDLLKVMMPTTQETADLRKAREALATAQGRLIYEDGRVIAVLAKE